VTTRRRGRPRSDTLGLVERVAACLLEDPERSANEVHLEVGGRRNDVLRAVKIVRRVTQSDQRVSTR
jgi:hypothetical protein